MTRFVRGEDSLRFFLAVILYLAFPICIHYISKYIALVIHVAEDKIFTVSIILYFSIPYVYIIFYPSIDRHLKKLKGFSKRYKYNLLLDAPLSASDPYVVLGVERASTNDEIRRAFHALLKRYHPDHVENMDPVKKSIALETTKKATLAFATIRKERGF